jgi:hypothetical protein
LPYLKIRTKLLFDVGPAVEIPFVWPPAAAVTVADSPMFSGPFVMEFDWEAGEDWVTGDAAVASGNSGAGVCFHVIIF